MPTSAIRLTRDLLRFNTINPPGDERDCAHYLARRLEAGGFRCHLHEFADKRTSLVAEIGGGQTKPPLCLTGHIDVVPLGAAPWSHDPFAGELDGDRLFGRGSTDMKGGIAAFVEAALTLAPKLHPTAGLVLVITAGEEVNCEGAKHLASHALLPRAGAIIIAEPSCNYPYIGHKGICWLELTSHGRTAHGSMPDKGDNALMKMAHAVTKLEHFDFGVSEHPIMGLPSMNVATFHSGLNTNSVPDSATVTLDTRTIPGINHAHLCHSVQSLLGGAVAVNTQFENAPLYTEPSDVWVQRIFEMMTPVLGERPDPRTIMFATDGPDLKGAMGGPPTIVLGPGDQALAHQTDEWLSVTRTEQSVAYFSEIIRDWCGV